MEPIFKITDDRFDADQIDLYDLKIEWHDCRLKFALKNTKSNTYIWFEDYFLGSYATFENSIAAIKDIFNSHSFLKANFWNSILVLIDTPLFLKIENELFDEQIPLIEYFKIVFPSLEPSDFKIIETQFERQRLLSGIPKVVLDFLNDTYQNKELVIKPKLAYLAEYISASNFLQSNNLLIVNDKWIDLIIPNTAGIILKKIPLASGEVNSKIFELLESNPGKALLYGEITPFSSIYRLIHSKNEQIQIGHLPGNLLFSQYFEEVPEQRHLSLFV